MCEEPTAGTSGTNEGKDKRVDAGETTGQGEDDREESNRTSMMRSRDNSVIAVALSAHRSLTRPPNFASPAALILLRLAGEPRQRAS